MFPQRTANMGSNIESLKRFPPVLGAEPIRPGTIKLSEAPASRPESPLAFSKPSPELHKSEEQDRKYVRNVGSSRTSLRNSGSSSHPLRNVTILSGGSIVSCRWMVQYFRLQLTTLCPSTLDGSLMHLLSPELAVTLQEKHRRP